jgi:CRISPR system Cascade subunit CasD
VEEIEDLAQLRFGVRVDQPGVMQRDFQTAINWTTGKSMPLSYRYYLADAVFVAGVEGDPSLLGALDSALSDPVFPLYLGRRACPTVGRVSLGIHEAFLEDALRSAPWEASSWYRRKQSQEVDLQLVLDALPDETGIVQTYRDVPQSFNPERREYGWREVAQRPPVRVTNSLGIQPRTSSPDWVGTVEGA